MALYYYVDLVVMMTRFAGLVYRLGLCRYGFLLLMLLRTIEAIAGASISMRWFILLVDPGPVRGRGC